MSVLFFGKRDDFYCEHAVNFITLNFPDATVILGRRGDPFPDDYRFWRGFYIISYLSPWIIPEFLLDRASVASINFHPGPPEYPGIGCTNFAIYHEAKEFGVTCHHMAASVDTGSIVAVRRFPLFPSDTVYSLTQRCYGYILQLFYEVVGGLVAGGSLPASGEVWQRRPYKRSELEALCKIDASMPLEEVNRRVRAVSFPGAPGAYIEVGSLRFELKTEAVIW